MGDPLNNPFGQQNIYRHLQSQGLAMDNPAGVPQAPPSLAPAIPSMPGGVQDPNQAKLWKAIGDQYRRGPNAGGNPTQVSRISFAAMPMAGPLHFFILLAFISLFLSFSLSHPIPNSHPSCIPLPSPLSTPFPPGHPTTIALRLLLMPRGVCVDGPFSLNWAASTATLDSLPRNLPVFATILTPDFRPQFLQNLAHMQPGQGGYRGNNTMALASGPQAGQPNLVQGNPTAQQQFLQQQSIQRLGLGLGQQQQQQQLGAAIQHPGLGNANHLNLTQGNNPALMSLMGMQGNAIGQLNNQIMNLRNPNVLEMQHRLDPGMNDQLQAIQRAQGGLNRPGLAQGGPGAATNQHIRLPGDGHNSPLLPAHDQNPMVGGLNRSPQPGNQPHQPNMPQTNPGVALIHKLDSLPIRDLEARVAAWRDNLPALENRVQELLNLANRQPEMMPAYSRSKQELEQNKFLYIKSQEILNRKHIAQSQMAQAQAQQAQAHAQAQAQNRMTPTLGEPVRPGSRAAGTMPGQVPGMTGWQQPGPSTTPQLPQGSPPGPSTTPFQPVPSPQPNLDQANQVRAAMNQNGTPRQSVIPRDRAAFVQFMRMWFVQTGRTSDAIPKIGDKPLDLHQLYVEVETLGGLDKVGGAGLWRLVAVKMGYVTHDQNDPQLAQIAKVLADAYVALLVPFDNFCLERMRAVGNGIQNNRINLGLGQPAIGMTPGGLRPGPGGVLPGGDGMSPMANFQRILAFLQVSLKDWMPELPAQAKLLRASQMDVPEMQRQGWPPERITAIQRFRPALMQYRATLMRQQELQRLSQQGQQQQIAQAQVHQQQLAQQQQQNQQSHLNDHRSSIGGGSLPPNMQAHNLGMPGGLKLPFSPEATSRAKVIVENIAREIEHSRQYQRREVLDSQRVQMNQTVVASHPFAVEFERTAALLREQHRILQSGQQHYIMSLEDVQTAQNALRAAIYNLKATYGNRVKQHQEAVANMRANENGGPGGPQFGQQAQTQQQQMQQVQQHMLGQQPQQSQQAMAAMSLLNANGGLAGPQLGQPRPPSQPQYGSPKPEPGKVPMNMMQAHQGQQQGKALQMAKPQRKPGAPVNTPSPAAAPTPQMESAPTPSSANEPATPKSPKNKNKATAGPSSIPAIKRTPTQAKKKPGKIDLPPPVISGFNQPVKRQREDDVPPAAEPIIPIAGPSSPKRVKTEFESVVPIKTEYINDEPVESMENALMSLQEVAPNPNGDGIDPDILAQLSEILEGSANVAPLASSLAPSLDQPPDAGPKVEDVFDFSYYLNDNLGDDEALVAGTSGVDPLEADTPDLNTNKETPDSAADDIEHLGQKSPGKGEQLSAGEGGGKNPAGSRAPTLGEGFWEAFDDGEMPEGAYFMGGGANGFSWSGPIDTSASWIGITGTAA
ncbi:hypothetical protein RHS04_09548 [Rhizoctonia solani]|uniref:ARID domain-containing protein n=1 Tax=Rhizoctonia solani TaxID=456999 RepID=A0A8H7LFE4_9AGAM|nr:hypothetical protein RHS04_09548 [Rhizoctonia solani]